MLVRIANREDPDQTSSSGLESRIVVRIANGEDPVRLLFRSSLIWVCTVSLGLFLWATSV